MQFITERNDWVENRKQDWSKEISGLLTPFSDNILNLIEELKEDYNDKSDPFKVHKDYIESLDSIFNELRDDVLLVKNKSTLTKLWDELTLNLVFWKEHFKNLSESLGNYSSIFKLGYEIFNVITRYNTKKIGVDYHDTLKNEEFDTIRTNVSTFLKGFKKDILQRITELSAEEIFDLGSLEDKPNTDYNDYVGDEIRYYKSDGEENNAIISYNQDDLDESKVRLVSKKTGEKFEIEKRDLIEIIPQEKTLNQEVYDKLKKIKDDPDKLKSLNGYLDEITESLVIEDKLDIVNLLPTIFKNSSVIEYEKPIVYFDFDGGRKSLKIIDVNGVFKEQNDYRVVGSHKITKGTDYLAFLTNSSLHIFKGGNYDPLENGDLLLALDTLVKKYKF